MGKQNCHLSPVLGGKNQTTKTTDHLCEHIPLRLCLYFPLCVYWMCQIHVSISAYLHICLLPGLPTPFFPLNVIYPRAYSDRSSLLPQDPSLANLIHIAFSMAMASKYMAPSLPRF